MITIRTDEQGAIVIDYSQEPRFDLARDGPEISTGLFVKRMEPGRITIDDAGQPGPVLLFITRSLRGLGYRAVLDSDLERRVRAYEAERKLVEDLKRRTRLPAPALNFGPPLEVKRPLLSHQIRAAKHALLVTHAANFSVPGSGKTTSALATYAAFRHSGVVERIMVIGPGSSFVPWEDEFRATFGFEPRTLRLIGTSRQRAEALRDAHLYDLVLSTYQMAYREFENLRWTLQQWRYLLVLDESHNIELGPWASTVIQLAPFAERRMILTGTPAPHSLRDLWSQFTFLWPSEAVLGNRLSYEQRLQNAQRTVEALKRELRPFLVRTKKSDLRLPKAGTKFYKIAYREIPKRQRLIIRLLELSTLQEAKELGLRKADLATLRRWRRARTIRLLQASSNPALLRGTAVNLGDPGDPLDSYPALARLLKDYERDEVPAKVALAVRLVRRLVSEGRKVVVWAHFVDNLLLLKALLEDLNPLLAYGAIPAYEDEADPDFESRERNIREFKSDPARMVLIANPAACAESISLHTVCQDTVYVERTFNCGQFLQSMDRIHRVGMSKDAHPTYHIPLIPSAVEQVVNRRLKQRQHTMYQLLDDDMPVMGYEDDSALLDREDDLEAIFAEVLEEIARSGRTQTAGPTARGRSRRRTD